MEIRSHYEQVHRETRRIVHHHVAPALPYWIAGGITGFIASLYAIAFRWLTERSLLLFERHLFIWSALVPIGFVVSFMLVRRYAPDASGSGIPQVMSVLERLDREPEKDGRWVRNLLGARIVLIKILSSLSMISVGGAIGREGPTIQIGSSLFLMVEDFFVRRGWVLRKNPLVSRKAFILAGGAAGIAAAFNTPLGGIVFAIEELARDSFKHFRTTVITGVIVAGVTAQALLGSYLYLGQPTLAKMTWLSVVFGIFVGGAAGGMGGFFGKTLYRVLRARRAVSSSTRQFLIVLLLAALFVGLAILSHGKSVGSGAEAIGEMLFKNHPVSFWDTPIRFLASQLSFLVGGAGGIFAPSLSVGANFGAYIGSLLPTGLVDPHLLILVGMAGFLTGVTHAPFTSLVLVIEMTDRSNAIFPLMLGTMTALWMTRLVEEHSFYEKMSALFFPDQIASTHSSEQKT